MKVYKKLSYKKFNKAIIKIKPSKMLKDEIGVFALRNLRKGTIIADLKLLGEDFFLAKEDYNKIDNKSKQRVREFCVAGDGEF